MTREDAQQLERIVGEMSESEKRKFVARLNRSLDGKQDQPVDRDEMTPEERQTVLDVLEEIESLPCEEEPDDGLVVSRDYRKVLYDGSSDTGFPEKPHK